LDRFRTLNGASRISEEGLDLFAFLVGLTLEMTLIAPRRKYVLGKDEGLLTSVRVHEHADL